MTRALFIAGGIAGMFAAMGAVWLVLEFFGNAAFVVMIGLLVAGVGGLYGLMAYNSYERRRRP